MTQVRNIDKVGNEYSLMQSCIKDKTLHVSDEGFSIHQ